MVDIDNTLRPPLCDLLLAVADDKLMLGHRNSDWTGLGPILEEDIAFSALAQDDVAHAKALYEFISEIDGRSADELAYGRSPAEYRCAAIVEVPDEFNWGTAIVRQLFCNHHDLLRLQRLSQSSLKPLAQLAARLAAEQQLHIDHTDGWIVRLGTGTAESHDRVQQALDALAPLAPWLFEPFDGLKALVDAKLYPGSDFTMYDLWLDRINRVLGQGNLSVRITIGSPDNKGGRRGVHTKHFPALLDEMCEVYRIEPGAKW